MSYKAEPAFVTEPVNKQEGGFRFGYGKLAACLLI